VSHLFGEANLVDHQGSDAHGSLTGVDAVADHRTLGSALDAVHETPSLDVRLGAHRSGAASIRVRGHQALARRRLDRLSRRRHAEQSRRDGN